MQIRRWQWLPAWLGGAAIGVANGAGREATYGRRLSPDIANRVSVLTALLAFTAYFGALQRRWPMADRSEALSIGALWLLLTVLFEFGLGRLVAKKPWRELMADYDVRRGRLWPFVLLAIASGPELARRRAPR